MAATREDPALHDTERWFARRGLPLFIEDYNNGRDVWTRAVPALVVTFLLVVVAPVVGVDASGDVRVDVAVPAILALAALVVSYAVVNRLRGRPLLAVPRRVGWPVLTAYVLVPAVIDLVGQRSPGTAVATAIELLVLLGVIWVVTRYAVLALTWWAVRHMFRELGSVYRLATRALPLLLLVATILFITTEMWQVAGTMPWPVLWGAIAFFVVLGLAFLAGRLPGELRGMELGPDAGQVVDACRGTPLAAVAGDLPDLGRPVPLQMRQRVNIAGVALVSQVVQVVLFALVVWAFFVAFGAVAVSIPVQQAWMGDLVPVEVIVPLFADHGVTRPLLRTATFLGGFSAFYVTIVSSTDAAYQREFFRGIAEQVGRSVAVRRAYVSRRRQLGLPAPAPVDD